MSGNFLGQREKHPVLVLTCQRDSHPFQERTVVLNEVVKVGRSVARVKPAANNAIFDCKVLSRSHALIWYKNGQFWLRDTNSSNGTFVNNTRIVQTSEDEPADREIFSGDIIRFGVDVVEHDTTHGCIIAQVTLYYPSGVEAKQSIEPIIVNNSMVGVETFHAEQIFRLTHFVNEILFREQALENKIESVRCLLQETLNISEAGWQAMLNEQRLLEKLDLYENQLSLLKQTLPENSLQSQLAQALEEKFNLEKASKLMLENLLSEKTEAISKATDLEHCLENTQKECTLLRQDNEKTQEAYQNLAHDRQTRLALLGQLEKQLKELGLEKRDLQDHIVQKTHEVKMLQSVLDQVLSLPNKPNTDNNVNTSADTHNNPNSVGSHINADVKSFINGFDNALTTNVDALTMHDEMRSSNMNQSVKSEVSVSNQSQPDQHSLSSQLIKSLQFFAQSAQLLKSLQDELNNLSQLQNYLQQKSDTFLPSDTGKSELGKFNEHCIPSESFENDFSTCMSRTKELVGRLVDSQIQIESVLGLLSTLESRNINAAACNTSGDVCSSAVVSYEESKKPIDNLSTPSLPLELSETGEVLDVKAELKSLQEELRATTATAESYRQLADNFKKQDTEKTELLLSVQKECDDLRQRIVLVEQDVATSRADHQRLILEARRAQAEVDELQRERDKLNEELSSANRQVLHLQTALATTLLGDKTANVTDKINFSNERSLGNNLEHLVVANTVQPIQQASPSQPNEPSVLIPSQIRLLAYNSLSLFAVIPVMIFLCAVMAYIFLKFA